MSGHSVLQPTLLGNEGPSFDPAFGALTRRDLGDESWIDHAQGFLAGHQTVFATLHDDTRWHGHRRVMYDRLVDVPRLTASIPRDGPGHPVIREIADALGERYGVTFDLVALALVATLSLGDSRRFLVRPHGGGPSVSFSAGWGDLLVMGGACQFYREHCVPKARQAGPRISVMFRSSADFVRF